MTEILRERSAAHRVLGAVIVVVLCIGIAAAIAGKGPGAIAGAGRLDTEGRAFVTRVDGTTLTVSGPTTLHDGDVAEAREGTMTLELPDGTKLEGRPGGARSEATKVKAGPVVELVRGELLVTAAHAARVSAADNQVKVQPSTASPAAVRLARSLAVKVGAYSGSAVIDSAGQQRTVPALREMEIAVLGRPPAAPKPLAVDHPDAWDLRFLGEALELGGTLQSLSNAYSATLRADEGRTAAFYENLLPALANVQGFDDSLVRSAPSRLQGETLVGAAIVALGRIGDTPSRWSSVFAFRDDGAAWGLVALDQMVSSGPLLAAVKGAVDHTTFEFAAPAAAPVTPAATPPTTGTPSTTPTTTPTTQPDTPTTEPGGTLPPVTQPTLPPFTLPPVTLPPPPSGGGSTGTLVGGVVDTVGQLLGGLLGGG